MTTSTSAASDNSQLKALLVSTMWWSGPAKLAIALVRHGCRVEVICPPDHPFLYVEKISRIYPYNCLKSLQALSEAITLGMPQVIIPCDDGAVWQLHQLHKTNPELRPLIERSLGAAQGYDIALSRGKLMQLAKELNIRSPETAEIGDRAALRQWFSRPGASGVLKLDRSYGGKGVRTARSLAEAERSLAALQRIPNVLQAWGRWLAVKDALAFWNLKHSRQPVITLQQFIVGRPANTMFVCLEGTVLAMVTVEVLCTEGSNGAALVVRIIENDEIRVAAEKIARQLQLSGFHGLDFMIEQETGHAYLIELNPRCTQLGHLPIGHQGDLAGVFCQAFTKLPTQQRRNPITEDVVAFFPQALMSEPLSSYIQTAFMDIPWEEPRLVRELMRGDWRERRLLGRLYFGMHSQKRTAVAWSPKKSESGS